MSLSPVIKKVLLAALAVAVVLLLLSLVRFYKTQASEAQERLQSVTNELTNTRDEYARYVTEQDLIRDVLALGSAKKAASQEKTDEAIKQHKREGSRVTVTGTDYSILHNRSREVRENASGALK